MMNKKTGLILILLVTLVMGIFYGSFSFPLASATSLTSSSGVNLTLEWTSVGDQGGAEFGYSARSAGDVNGDGYDDIIVGIPRQDVSIYREGVALVYHGSESGINPNPDWIAAGGQTGSRFGNSVSGAGDVNDDGYDDVIIGAYEYKNYTASAGAAFVFYGSPSGLKSSPVWSVVSLQVDANYGVSVGTAGDVNDDGYDDVIVGAKWYEDGQNNEGAAFVYYGSEDGPSLTHDWMAESNVHTAGFGASVGTAGDVNGDEYDDVIVGAPLYTNDQDDEGAVFVYLGSAGGLSTSHSWQGEGDQEDAQYGAAVGTAGDVNSDGYDDIVIGAPNYTLYVPEEGAAFVYHGSSGGPSALPDWSDCNLQSISGYGTSVGTAGDVNRDGYGDVVVGAYQHSDDQPREGAVYVYSGSPGGLSASAKWSSTGDKSDTWFGYAVGTAGDVNNDGFADLVVGAPQFRQGTIIVGRAFAYFGGPASIIYLPQVMKPSQ